MEDMSALRQLKGEVHEPGCHGDAIGRTGSALVDEMEEQP